MYVPDIDDWELWEEAEEAFKAHQVCIVDATFYDKTELSGISRDLASIPHPSVCATVKRFGHLSDSRSIVLSHLNHSNPICMPDSAEALSVKELGFFIADDGMQFRIQTITE